MEFYSLPEIEQIIMRSTKILGISLDKDASREIAKRSRSTPRTANHLLKRVRDYAQVHKKPLDNNTVTAALDLLGVDSLGLTPSDRDLLTTLINKFKGGPVGLSTLSAALSEEVATIEEFNEPYLLQMGLLERTPRGRIATPRAYEHLGLAQKKLL